MKIFNTLLFFVGIYSITMYGSSGDIIYGGVVIPQRAMNWLESNDLERYDYSFLGDMSREERVAYHKLAVESTKLGRLVTQSRSTDRGENESVSDHASIFSPRSGEARTRTDSPFSKAISPVHDPIVTTEVKKATCSSRLLSALGYRSNKVYVAGEDEDLRD